MSLRKTGVQVGESIGNVAVQRSASNSAQSSSHYGPLASLMRLQRVYGNNHVQRLLSAAMIQRVCGCGGTCAHCRADNLVANSITVNEPGDVYEQEADQVADKVMGMSGVAPATPDEEGLLVDQYMPLPKETPEAVAPVRDSGIAPAACGVCHGPEEAEEVHRKETDESGNHAVSGPVIVPAAGQPMNRALRDFFEPRFGYAFDHVRIHTDAQAASSARSLNALAYTLGRDIVFGAGQHQPETTEGRRLIAHELTHVVQQSATASPRPAAKPIYLFPAIQARPSGAVIQRWTMCDGDASLNTIICNGSGKIDVQLGGTGNANQTACLSDCMRKHEESHKADALAANANIWGGEVAGRIPCFSNNVEQSASEKKASNVEISCLRGKQSWTRLPWNKKCVPIISARITQMEQYRDSF